MKAMVISSSCLPTCQKLHTPKYLHRDHLTLFFPLLFIFLLVLSKSSQEQNSTAHSANTSSLCSQNFSRIQGKHEIGRKAVCLKERAQTQPKSQLFLGEGKGTCQWQGRIRTQVTVQLFWHNPRGRAEDKNEESRVDYLRPGPVEPCTVYFGLNAQGHWRSWILPKASNVCVSP